MKYWHPPNLLILRFRDAEIMRQKQQKALEAKQQQSK